MSRHLRPSPAALSAVTLVLAAACGPALATSWPVTPEQRNTAQEVASAGVPLSDLAPNAPDSYTVKRHDTLWDISKLYLKSPWRWPELWGMNLQQIRNPHLIYPGQILYLEKSNGRARLVLAKPIGGGTEKLEPRIREEALGDSAIASIPMNLIGPFLNDAVVFDTNALAQAPRIVATQEGRIMLARGETAYVRGDVSKAHTWQLFREPKPLKDPATGEVLGYEARNVGTAELKRLGEQRTGADGKTEIVPATFTITQLREEAMPGDLLAPLPPHDYEAFAPHAPKEAMKGQVVSVYGDSMNAGQNQIVSLNRGAHDGIERGNVLALWHAGAHKTDTTTGDHAALVLPDERVGLVFVFRVFDRVSYGLILSTLQPIGPGDIVTQP